jgi:hypothetical protein
MSLSGDLLFMVPVDMKVIYFAEKQFTISQASSRRRFLAEGNWAIDLVAVAFCILDPGIRNRTLSLIILLPMFLKSSSKNQLIGELSR